jgi:hypothetical protein
MMLRHTGHWPSLKLTHAKLDVCSLWCLQAMLNQLETRYYASPQLPHLAPGSAAASEPRLPPEVQELYMLALQAPLVGPSEEAAAAAGPAATAVEGREQG